MEDILCLDGKLEVIRSRTGKQMLELTDQATHIPLIQTGSGPIKTGTTQSSAGDVRFSSYELPYFFCNTNVASLLLDSSLINTENVITSLHFQSGGKLQVICQILISGIILQCQYLHYIAE
jgi:hypothetical protein